MSALLNPFAEVVVGQVSDKRKRRRDRRRDKKENRRDRRRRRH